jgi:hypothetical protein
MGGGPLNKFQACFGSYVHNIHALLPLLAGHSGEEKVVAVLVLYSARSWYAHRFSHGLQPPLSLIASITTKFVHFFCTQSHGVLIWMKQSHSLGLNHGLKTPNLLEMQHILP